MEATTSVRGPNWHEQLICHLHDGRAMRDHDDDGAVIARLFDGAHQGPFADGVEIGIRLVQHDQARAVVEAA
eukprot:gene22768-27050_t